MNDLFDEDTVILSGKKAPEGLTVKQTHTDEAAVSLSHASVLKNHARFHMAQQHGDLFNNRILNVSTGLMSLMISVKRMACPDDLFAFRTGIKHALTELKYKIAALDYPPSIADKACFLYAVMLDEQIIHASWGDSSGWENQTLVSELFNIKNGGEQFYIITERALLQPVLLVDLLELIYIMIKIGFRGRYRQQGQEQLNALIKRLEEAVFARSQAPTLSHDERMQPVQADADAANRVRRPKRPTQIWRSIAIFGGVIATGWVGLHSWYQATAPQRAIAFVQLSQYTQPFYGQDTGQDQEFIYRSTTNDITPYPNETAIPAASGSTPAESKQAPVPKATTQSTAEDATNASAKPSSTTVWMIQLGTFSSTEEAQRFEALHQSALPQMTTTPWKNNLYRVMITAPSRREANDILATAKKAGISDAFLFTTTQSASKPSSFKQSSSTQAAPTE